jgi:hypothetical protein
MSWLHQALDGLARGAACGYRPSGTPATEPTALAALALLTWQRHEPAVAKLEWLAQLQADDGSLGISAAEAAPGWPTSLAILAWAAWEKASPNRARFTTNIAKAIDWLLRMQGKPIAQRPEGHDSTLIGWPWVEGTHSWIEPTALAVLALKAAGHGKHQRTGEAVRLILDRLLTDGGCNYGNTVVLGQMLRPHLQPTGLALLALTGENDPSGGVQRSIDYLHRELSERTAPSSLSYALLGMAAHNQETCQAEEWLADAAPRALMQRAALQLSLLALAAAGRRCPLIQMTNDE